MASDIPEEWLDVAERRFKEVEGNMAVSWRYVLRESLEAVAPLIRRAALEEAAKAAGFAAWKHEGDDDFSRGMDKGAREQVHACVSAILALAEKQP